MIVQKTCMFADKKFICRTKVSKISEMVRWESLSGFNNFGIFFQEFKNKLLGLVESTNNPPLFHIISQLLEGVKLNSQCVLVILDATYRKYNGRHSCQLFPVVNFLVVFLKQIITSLRAGFSWNFIFKNKKRYLHWGMLVVIFEKMKRSSRPEVFCEKGFRRNFTKFTGDSDTGVFLWILRNF